jgi:hypothetical protein
MKTKLLCFGIILFSISIFGQNEINTNFIKYNQDIFIFNGKPDIYIASETTPDNSDIIYHPIINSTFYIVKECVKTGNHENGYIIEFLDWNTNSFLQSKKRQNTNIRNALSYNYKDVSPKDKNLQQIDPIKNIKFNIKTGEKSAAVNVENTNNITGAQSNNNEIIVEKKYFFITEKDLLSNAKIYNPSPKFEFTFGTIAYFVKIRPRFKNEISSQWSTDIAGGLTYGPKCNITKNWGVSALGGLTLSKIKLDSISTRGFIPNKIIEKVAITPTLNLLFTYKNFTFGEAIGMDWINDDSPESARWVYNLFSIGDNQIKTNSSSQ